MKDKVLDVMREAGKPVSAGDVVKLSGMDKSVQTKRLKNSKRRRYRIACTLQMGTCGQIIKKKEKTPGDPSGGRGVFSFTAFIPIYIHIIMAAITAVNAAVKNLRSRSSPFSSVYLFPFSLTSSNPLASYRIFFCRHLLLLFHIAPLNILPKLFQNAVLY